MSDNKEQPAPAAAVHQQPPPGSRRPEGDWTGDTEPGGCECSGCGCIFIGSEWRDKCKACAALPLDRVDPTACPECIGMGCSACGGTGDRAAAHTAPCKEQA